MVFGEKETQVVRGIEVESRKCKYIQLLSFPFRIASILHWKILSANHVIKFAATWHMAGDGGILKESIVSTSSSFFNLRSF